MAIQEVIQDDGVEWGAVPEEFKKLLQPPPAPNQTEAQAVSEPVEIIDTEQAPPEPAPAILQAAAPAAPDSTDKLIEFFANLMTQSQSQKFQNGLARETETSFLMSMLSESARVTLRQLAHDSRVTVIEVVAGNLMLQADRGTLGEFAHAPHWREMVFRAGEQTVNGQVATNHTPTCEQCGLVFPSERAGQRFCCSACGKRGAGYKEIGPEHDKDCRTPLMTVKRNIAQSHPQQAAS